MDTIPPHPPDVLLETSDPDQSLDFDFDDSDLIEASASTSSSQQNTNSLSTTNPNTSIQSSQSTLSLNSINFQCQICGQAFQSLDSLHNHVSLDHNNFNHQAFLNNLNPLTTESFDLLTSTSNDTASKMSTESLNMMTNHVNMHNQNMIPVDTEPLQRSSDDFENGDVFKCVVCSQQFVDIRLFEKHMLSHGEERSYVCPQCSKTYKYKWDLNRHFERKHMNVNNSEDSNNAVDFDASQFINNFQCNVCSKNFLEKTQFELHCQESRCGRLLNEVSDGDQSSDEDENGHPAIFKCYNCPQSFDSRLLFKQHKLLHVRMYSCSKCSEKFVKFDSFHAHLCNSSSAGTPTLQQQLDSNNSTNNSGTQPSRISPLTVNGIQNVNIGVPDLSNNSSNLQQQHYTCGICSSVFTHKAIYDRHCAAQDCRLDLRNHPQQQHLANAQLGDVSSNISDLKPAASSNRFSSSPALSVVSNDLYPPINESANHSGSASNSQPTPDPCEICGKRFATLSNLKRHMMSHSKIRNFKCLYCHKSYIYKWDLTNHIKKAHKGKSIDDVKPLYSTREFYPNNENSSDVKRRRNPARSSTNHSTTNSPSSSVGASSAKSATANQGNMRCKHCGGVFLGQNSLHAHMILRHSGVIDDANDITNELMHFVEHYTCSFCGKSFSDKQVYRNHLGTHGEKGRNGGCSATGNLGNLQAVSPSPPEIYCNGCKAELMTEGIDLPSDEEVEYLCDVCDNERKRQEEAAGLAL